MLRQHLCPWCDWPHGPASPVVLEQSPHPLVPRQSSHSSSTGPPPPLSQGQGPWHRQIPRHSRRHIPAKTSLTQWRFFKKCRIEDIFCFVSVFTQIFFKVIGNLWAYYKCHLGRMHHVGTWAFTQQRVFSPESPQSNLNYFRQQAFHDSKPIWADASVHYASEKYIVRHVILFSWKVLLGRRIRGNCKSKNSHLVI